jgi:hypothetical protein
MTISVESLDYAQLYQSQKLVNNAAREIRAERFSPRSDIATEKE